VFNARISLVKSLRRREEAASLGDLPSAPLRELLETELSIHLAASKAARKAGRNQLALNSIVMATGLQEMLDEDSNKFSNVELQEESAYVYWERTEHGMALSVLQQLLDSLQTGRKAPPRFKVAHLLAQIVSR
jgi:hypothetical protein